MSTKAKTPTEEVTYTNSLVLYADAGVKPNPGSGGWGIHGYAYTTQPPKKGLGLKVVLTPDGYQEKKAAAKEDFATTTDELEQAVDEKKVSGKGSVTPVFFIDGYGSMPNISNNAGEVIAGYQAIDFALRNHAAYDFENVKVLSDSEYFVVGSTSHLDRWSKNGWLRADGQPISNLEHWKRLSESLNGLREKGTNVSFQWVRGHNGDYGNTIVDEYATMGRRLAAQDIYKNDVNISADLKEYFEKPDSHPFFHHPTIFALTNSLNKFDGEYYSGSQEDEIALYGKRSADGAYAYLKVEKPVELIEYVKLKVFPFVKRDDQLLIINLNTLFNKANQRRIVMFGNDALYRPSPMKLDFCMSNERKAGDEPVVMEINPPLISKRAVDALNEMKGVLLDFLENKDTKVASIDITDILYEAGKKDELVLKKDVGSSILKLDVLCNYRTDSEVKEKKVSLTLGIDLPDRNSLKRIEKMKPKVSLITWKQSDKTFRYACTIQAGQDSGIWAGYYSNLVLLD